MGWWWQSEQLFDLLSNFELIELPIKIIYSPLLIIIQYFIILVWPCISIERKSYLSCSLRTSSVHFHGKPDFFHSCKTTNTLMDMYMTVRLMVLKKGGYTDKDGCGSVGVWNIYHNIWFTMWFCQFINCIAFRWYYVLWCIVSILMWIGILEKLKMYRVPPYPIKWYCQGFVYICI